MPTKKKTKTTERSTRPYRRVPYDLCRRELKAVSPTAKLVYLLLLTGPLSCMCPGLVEAQSAAMLSLQFGLDVAACTKALDELEAAGLAQVDRQAWVIFLPDALAWDQPDHGPRALGWCRACQSLPESPARRAWLGALLDLATTRDPDRRLNTGASEAVQAFCRERPESLPGPSREAPVRLPRGSDSREAPERLPRPEPEPEPEAVPEPEPKSVANVVSNGGGSGGAGSPPVVVPVRTPDRGCLTATDATTAGKGEARASVPRRLSVEHRKVLAYLAHRGDDGATNTQLSDHDSQTWRMYADRRKAVLAELEAAGLVYRDTRTTPPRWKAHVQAARAALLELEAVN